MHPNLNQSFLVYNEDIFRCVLEEKTLRQFIQEIIRACDGGKVCLFTKKKDPKTGKRRRLGTHSSRSGAERQERAIKMHGG